MNILGIDTSALKGSVALVDKNGIIREYPSSGESSYSKRLLKIIDHTFEGSNLTIKDINGISVANGPGSFTALRVGVATAYGLSIALRIPVTGVSSLLGMAASFPHITGLLCPVIDARRGEIYTALYRNENGVLNTLKDDFVISPFELGTIIKEPVTFLGDDFNTYKDNIKKTIDVPISFQETPKNGIAATIAVLGLKKIIIAGHNLSEEKAVSLNYIRQSDAKDTKGKGGNKDGSKG